MESKHSRPLKIIMRGGILLCAMALACAPVAAQEYSDGADRLGGRMEAMVDGERMILPTLKTDIMAELTQDLATVTVKQVFANPSEKPMHATYLFPLNKDAAVFEMIMEAGDERIQAQIKRKEEAKKTYEKARIQGRNAALLVQHRPNMFTQKVANLMPGQPVTVTLRYVHPVPRIDGRYELVLPLVVGPRYQPAGAGAPPEADAKDGQARPREISSATPFGQWELEALPPYPGVAGLDLPHTIAQDRVSITIHMDDSMAVESLRSPTHPIAEKAVPGRGRIITLDRERILDNKDFVLSYSLAGPQVAAGAAACMDQRGGFFSLLVEPPAQAREEAVAAREMVFVLDVSGSMSGKPLDASKTYMLETLSNLRSKDYFRIVIFSSDTSEFSSRPLEATPENIAQAKEFVRRLHGGGGTEMARGINQALGVPPMDGAVRLVVFLTDGYIGNEQEILRLIGARIGGARLFALGVGTGVNRHLLSEMGKMGRGFARFVSDAEDSRKAALDMEKRLNAPVLTDVAVDWGNMPASECVPTVIPDLFFGQSLRLLGRCNKPGAYEIAVTGNIAGKKARLPVQLVVPEAGQGNPAIALAWARAAIGDAMEMINRPSHFREEGFNPDALKERVVKLGLEFSLATQWTSFVAVAEKIVNPNARQTPEKAAPLPMVEGVSEKAYPQASNSSPGHYGYSTPEPATLGGLALCLGAAAAAFRKRRRKCA